MAEAIEKVPAQTRWEIATKGLTGACTAMLNTLKGTLSQEKFDELQVGLWSQAGKGAKELADTLGLTIENPRDIDEALALLAVTGMGPEFEFKTVEATDLHMIFLYAAARYNAHVAKNVLNVDEHEPFVNDMMKAYQEMLRNHLADPNL